MPRHGMSVLFLTLIASTISWASPGLKAQGEEYGDALGTVDFPISCEPAAARPAARGLALLHHMTYEGSRELFEEAVGEDTDCAMAYWGQAMTFIHPLWSDPPSEEDFQRGRALVETARQRGEKTERERLYIEAAAAYFAAGWNRNETLNLAEFEAAWKTVFERFPEDPEAASLYALAQLGTADPSDKTYAQQKRAAALVENVLARIPDHPGAHHYTIHSYDYPPLADRALEVARNYGNIAPDVPHALHMPTHIFTRLGLWSESIAGNERSAAAALKHPVGDAISTHYLHALDYLAYAHLQRGEERQAEKVARILEALEGPFQSEVATPYTFAAVPVRLALERRRWVDALTLEPRQPEQYPWDLFPAIEAITYFGRALGAARLGKSEAAREAIDRMASLRESAATTSAYWAQQVDIQRLSAEAWLAYAEGNSEKALETMRSAAELEASTEKHPVTPGEVLPARELLADLLFEMGKYEGARAAYEATLHRSPKRLNSLYGAGRASEMLGDRDKARSYFTALVEMCPEADSENQPVSRARKLLSQAATEPTR